MFCLYMAYMENEYDKRLFEQIYDKYKLMMYNITYSILKDEQLAEDAVHEAFLTISRNMKKITEINKESHKKLRNYLIIVTKNTAKQAYKKNKSRYSAEMIYIQRMQNSNIENVELDVENTDHQQRFFKIIKSLDEKYSDVLILKYYYEMSDKEIANHLGIKIGNAKVRLSRAKDKLKELLEREKFYDKQKL